MHEPFFSPSVLFLFFSIFIHFLKTQFTHNKLHRSSEDSHVNICIGVEKELAPWPRSGPLKHYRFPNVPFSPVPSSPGHHYWDLHCCLSILKPHTIVIKPCALFCSLPVTQYPVTIQPCLDMPLVYRLLIADGILVCEYTTVNSSIWWICGLYSVWDN